MITPPPSRPRPSFGRIAQGQLFSAAIVGLAGLALACGDDDPAPQTAVGGSGSVPDASVRDLPGDGREPTPDSDTDSRQREPIGPQRLNDVLDRIRNGLGQDAGASGGAPDAPDDGEPSDGGAG